MPYRPSPSTTSSAPPSPARALLNARLVHAALSATSLLVLAVFVFLRQGHAPGEGLRGEPSFLSTEVVQAAALLGVVMGAILANVLPNAAIRAQLPALAERTEEERERQLAGLWRTARILRWALVEAALLLNGVFFLVAGQPMSLTLALALLVLLLVRAPRRAELDAFLSSVTPPEGRGGPPAGAPR